MRPKIKLIAEVELGMNVHRAVAIALATDCYLGICCYRYVAEKPQGNSAKPDQFSGVVCKALIPRRTIPAKADYRCACLRVNDILRVLLLPTNTNHSCGDRRWLEGLYLR